jgi:hypothetical protein
MLYWERRRSRIVQPRSLPSLSVHGIVQTPQVSFVEQLPFPQRSESPVSFSSPRSGEANTSAFFSRSPSSQVSSSGGFGEWRKPTVNLFETPVPVPPSPQPDMFGGVNTYFFPDGKAGPTFCLIPKSPTTSFYQPVIPPSQREKASMTCAYPPQSGKQRVMVLLSIVCLCLFVILSVLMLLFPMSNGDAAIGPGAW